MTTLETDTIATFRKTVNESLILHAPSCYAPNEQGVRLKLHQPETDILLLVVEPTKNSGLGIP